MANIDPAKTYTLEGFIESGVSDDMTYYNFSLIEMIDGIQHLDRNVIEEYIDELKPLCIDVPLDSEEYSRYKYNPDLLAYDIYGSTQLDFIILLLNDTFDPKEFDKKRVKLPHASTLSTFLNTVYSTESKYIKDNRSKNGII